MDNPQVIASLEATKAELAEEMRAFERRIADLRADIAALDRAMVLLDPEHVRAKAPRRRPAIRPFPRGELRAFVLGTIRDSTGDLSDRLLAT